MKIAFVCSNYLPFLGGVEIHAQQVSQALAQRHEVRVAAMNFAANKLPVSLQVLNTNLLAPSYPDSMDGSVPVTSLAPRSLDRIKMLPLALRVTPKLRSWFYHPINRITHVAYRAAVLPKLRRFIAGADIVHGLVHGDIGWAAQRAAQQAGLPFVCTPFVHPQQWGDGPNDVRLYQRSQAVIGLVESDRAYLQSLGVEPAKLHTIGVSPCLPENADGAAFREKHQLGDAPLVLYVGRMMAAKGAAAVLRSAPQVWATVPDARFVFIGPSSGSEAEIFNGADPRVLHLGRVAGDEKANALAACDLMAMPSMSEILPTVYLEAWSLKKPVLGGLAHGLTELVSGNQAGINASQEPGEVANAIVKLLTSTELAKQLGENGYRLVQEKYTVDAVSRSLETLYQSLIQEAISCES